MKDTRTLLQRLTWTWRKCLVFESYRLDTMSQARQILAENFIFYTEEWLNRDYLTGIFTPVRWITLDMSCMWTKRTLRWPWICWKPTALTEYERKRTVSVDKAPRRVYG